MKVTATFSIIIAIIMIFITSSAIYAQVTKEDYARAQQFLPGNAEKLVFKQRIDPQWIENSDRFWYRNDTRSGKEFVLVDPVSNTQRPAFDHVKLAAALSLASGTAYEHNKLPFDSFKFTKDGGAIKFDIEEESWTCNIKTYECSKRKKDTQPSPEELLSPDGCWAAIAKNDNLYVRAIESGEEIQLTTDGEPYYNYATVPDCSLRTVTYRLQKKKFPPVAIWSPDSKKLLTHKLDQRKVKDIHLIQFSPPGGGRPVLYSYRYPLPGDKHMPVTELFVFDIKQKTNVKIDSKPLLVSWRSPISFQRVWWSKDSRQVYFIYDPRGYKEIKFLVADTLTGETRTIVEERSSSFLQLNPRLYTKPIVRILNGGRGVIWFSERDGWGHLYLYDGNTGQLKNQITSGAWIVHDIKYVDEEKRQIYFIAGGREKDRDPYYRHLYRINLYGSNIKLITPEDADHDIKFSPTGKYFIDTYSRVDAAPVSVLRSSDGKLIRKLEQTDIQQLLTIGWKYPEPFKAKARDGITDIYGVIFRPSNFDTEKRYPVVDNIYPGPQVFRTPKSFSLDIYQQGQAIAELGFIVVTIDGFGTPFRSKAFHDFCYGKMEDAGGIADHIVALRQLAARYPYMDLSRVGICGHSGGGFASTHAILSYPDFYKVAVSSAGNHDQRGYLADWGERYQGLLREDNYVNQANVSLAKNLKGKLLLATGDLDDNVHPALTFQLADALIKANKDFDLLIIPNANHGLMLNPYFIRKRWDYLVKHLMGVEPPKECEVKMKLN